MLARERLGDVGADVVADHPDPLDLQVIQQGQRVCRVDLGAGRARGAAGRLVAGAEAAQIRGEQLEAALQPCMQGAQVSQNSGQPCSSSSGRPPPARAR